MGKMEFQHQQPLTRLVAGPGTVDRIGPLADELGACRALLVCSPRAAETRLVQRVQASLGSRLAGVFPEVVPHPGTDLARAGARLARQVEADLLVSVGGGSTSDTAKGIALVLAEGERIEDLAAYLDPQQRLIVRPLSRPKLSLLAVPVTAAGAEVTPGLGLTNAEGIKQIWWDEKLAARVVVMDPEATSGVPFSLVASSGMNAMAHCVEGLYSRGRTPISDALAVAAIRHLTAGLEGLARSPGDLQAKASLQIGAVMSGMVVSNAKPALHHAICHILGARWHVPHGDANAILLPYVAAFNLEVATGSLARVAEAMGASDGGSNVRGAAEAAVAALRALRERLPVPGRLREFGISERDAIAIGEETMQDWCVAWNPRPVTSADIAGIVRAAL